MQALFLLLILAPQEDEARVAWLREHAVQVRTADPADEDFSDLKPLGRVLEGRRIVLLGEQSHGEGSVFLAKTRLIKFLHREMGFDVLAMESGFYECRQAWKRLAAGRPARESFSIGVFPIWTFSEQFGPLMDYVAAKASTDKPLELCGFDCQFPTAGGQGWSDARSALRKDLEYLGARVARSPLDREALEAIDAAFDEKVPEPGTLKAATDALLKLRTALDRKPPRGPMDEGGAFWKQALESLAAHAENRGRKPTGRMADDFNPRDAQSGRNLAWLAKTRYAGRKIIVWAATMHIARRVEGIDTRAPGLNYKGVRPMGQVAAETLGREMYVLGFDALRGRRGHVFSGRDFPIEKAPDGSLAALAAKAGLKTAWIDFSRLPEESPFRRKMIARPLGNAAMEADWTQVVDGMLFQDEVEPSRPRGR
jgi:erythromycin esterase